MKKFKKGDKVRLVCEKCKQPAELELLNINNEDELSAVIRCSSAVCGHTISVGGKVVNND